jgi:type VI secretion system protein ImpF
MVELTPQERLQPALLDRLTDERPDLTSEPIEGRVLTKSQLRAAVLRDLTWLLNTVRLSSLQEIGGFPHVEDSVVNYGMPAFSGETASSLDITDLERAIREAIIHFEPRLIAETLRVEAVSDSRMMDWHNVVSIQITGQLWAQPVPLELILRTEIDLETGQIELSEVRNG